MKGLLLPLYLGAALLFPVAALATEPAASTSAATPATEGGASHDPIEPSEWDGKRALADIATQLSFGARSLGKPGHEAAIAFIERELAKLAPVVLAQRWSQSFEGKSIALTNIIARYNPSRDIRIIAGTHYDSIVRAYRDAKEPNGAMPGANNSASGVAVLLETARVLTAMAPQIHIGIDLVFFDGEEGPISLGAGDPNWLPLGSPFFARQIEALYPKGKPESSVIFDMVCYRELKLYPEPMSVKSAPGQVKRFWELGHKIAPKIFVERPLETPIFDDQVALAAAGVPSLLVIGFDYEPWFNTTEDTIDKCSPASLEAVGRTLLNYFLASAGQHP